MQNLDFEVSPDRPMRSVMQLRTRFFKWHTDLAIPKHPRGIDPITLVLNPPKYVDDNDPFCVDTWFAVYYRSYYVKVEKSHLSPFHGPHIAKLYLQVYPAKPGRRGSHEWIGTATFKCIFTNEEQLRICLRRAIRTRQYFVSDKTEEILIDMNPPEETQTIATI